MQLNQFFNGLPIQILGTHHTPFFYASEVGAVLGIVNVQSSTENFNDIELVTPAMRQQHNLITYRRYLGGERRLHPKARLLTELGVYRLINNSQSPRAKEIQALFRNAIVNMRQNAIEQLNIRHAHTIAVLAEQNVRLAAQNAELAAQLANQLAATANYVYFIRAVTQSTPWYVKIGRSRNPIARMAQLQTGCPLTLEIAATVECDAVNVERELHRLYNDKRIAGEWFTFSPDELDEAICTHCL